MGLEPIEFVMSLEEEFDISLSDADTSRMTNVGRAFDVLAQKLKDARRSQPDDELWQKLVELTLETGDYRPKKLQTPITRETRFIDDLGWG